MAHSRPQKPVQLVKTSLFCFRKVMQGNAPSALIRKKISFAELQQAEISILNFTQIGQEIYKWLDRPSGPGSAITLRHTAFGSTALGE
jgi:hypothetical protein